MATDPQVKDFGNDPSLEMAWAVQAAKHANVYMNLLISTDATTLSLHKHQETLYSEFRCMFPKMDVIKVCEAELKGSNLGEWRKYCDKFKELVEDYNLGTILRIRANEVYSEDNTIIVPKVIFLAIEVARNKEGLNEKFRQRLTQENLLI